LLSEPSNKYKKLSSILKWIIRILFYNIMRS
jgi:hypothetical protein